ncbi:hypothetical protein ACET7H_04770 [Aeromonas veronii]|uniref:hypothetical protein n=1 Tax=Aeromonas veronii TaxID=654 RepID=UPI0038F045C6
MNSKTTLLLSLLLVTGNAAATQQYQESSGSEFSVDELKFNLDWDDKQFGWTQNDCLTLDIGETSTVDCKAVKFNLEDEENRNQPPKTNQVPANSQSDQ